MPPSPSGPLKFLEGSNVPSAPPPKAPAALPLALSSMQAHLTATGSPLGPSLHRAGAPPFLTHCSLVLASCLPPSGSWKPQLAEG